MNFTIKKLSDDCDTKIRVRNFLFSQIRSEYGYGYIPSWHKDIVDLNKYYIDCRKNDLFFVENNDNGRIMASMAIRQYDKDFPEFRDIYSRETTASIWRSFVEKPYRRAYPEESCCRIQFLEKSGISCDFGYKQRSSNSPYG